VPGCGPPGIKELSVSMKYAPSLLCALLAVFLTASAGYSQTNDQVSKQYIPSSTDSTIRSSRVVGPARDSNHAAGDPVLAASTMPAGIGVENKRPNSSSAPVWGNAPAKVDERVVAPRKLTNSATPVAAPALTQIYRVGVGDVLDVKIVDMPTRDSTLFTVLAGGVLEYPLIEEPVKVEGLRVEEIAARLASRIKVLDHPRLVVNVRDHASHNVVVTGLVYNPGSKVLRQEAVPLYVVLAEAVAREGATRATINRNGQVISVDLADQTAISTLVLNGDLIKVSTAPPAPPQHYSVSGEINVPGEKVFRPGLTLTQSILASGGITQNAGGRVKVTSQALDGTPVIVECNVKDILEGRSSDPTIKPGDRVEVIRGRW
jgi:protein involved in polysaccharide export with SLBB domain